MARRRREPPPLLMGLVLAVLAAGGAYGLVSFLIGTGRPVMHVGWGPPAEWPDAAWAPSPVDTATQAPVLAAAEIELEPPPVAAAARDGAGPFGRTADTRPRRRRSEDGPAATPRPPAPILAAARLAPPPARVAPPPAREGPPPVRTPAHDEALALLTALEGLSKTPLDRLEGEIEGLRNLSASDPRVEVTRERCANAFADYLTAARRYGEAQQALEAIDVTRPKKVVLEQVGRQLTTAEEGAARAERSKALCFQGTRAMVAAFPPVRRDTVGLAP